MTVADESFTSCRGCGRDVTELFDSSVDPEYPIPDCPHCGTTVLRPRDGVRLVIRR